MKLILCFGSHNITKAVVYRMRNDSNLYEQNARSEAAPCTPFTSRIGARIRQRRLFLALTREQLAGKLGLTTAEVENYETGSVRISAWRIFEFSQELG
ncbi:MAG TPA: helix-turn-helix transcriptional regulator, partial [Acidiphilium sp.]